MNHITRRLELVYRSLYFPPLIIAIAILAATGATWRASRQSLHHDIHTAVSTRINQTDQAISNNLSAYEEILRGGVGLFQGSTEVTQSDFLRYLDAFSLDAEFPGVQGIGYVEITPADHLPELTTYMQNQGISSFQVHPNDQPHETYAPIKYARLVGSTNTPNYGFDMYSEPTRAGALYRARDTGQPAIAAPIHTIIANQPLGSAEAGFNLYVPYFDPNLSQATLADRQAAIRGYVFAAFKASNFFKNVESSSTGSMAAFKVQVANKSDGDLYHSPNFEKISKQSNVVRETQELSMYGETWIITYVFDQHGLVSDVQLRRPPSVLFAGVFTAILIGLVVLLLLRSRAQELAAQKEQAVELAKDELLSLASHQLRTPATGVKQYVGMVLQGFAGKVPSRQRDLLEKAYASNDRQLHIINQILHLAKIESGRIVLARQETDINSLVEDIVTEQQPDIEAAGHTLILRLPKKPIHLQIDAHTLRMAIENILSNAIKYTPGGGEIYIRVRKDAHHIYIRIKDTGVGIAPADLDKLFKQFSRLPNEMSLRVGGTGIGLYLAKHLVELHGGYIEVKSVVGAGSAFTVVLPLGGKEKEL